MGALAGLTGVGMGLDIASSLYGIISGIKQQREARKLMQEADQMPGYEMAPEIGQRLGLRQTMLTARQPAFQDLENDIFANQAATVFNARQAAPGSAPLLGAIGTAQAETNRALRQAAQQEAMSQEERVRGLEAAQAAMAGEREKAYAYNVYEPQQRKYQLGAEMLGVGQGNVYGGLKSLAGMAQSAYRAESENSVISTLFRQLMGSRQAPALEPLPTRGLPGRNAAGMPSSIMEYLTPVTKRG